MEGILDRLWKIGELPCNYHIVQYLPPQKKSGYHDPSFPMIVSDIPLTYHRLDHWLFSNDTTVG